MALTELEIKHAKPRGKPYPLSDGDGLILLVQKNGSKSWILRYRMGGKDKRAGLGKYPKVSLASARKQKMAFKRELVFGGNPKERRAAERREAARIKAAKAATFGKLAREWYASREGAWSDSSRAGVRHMLDACLLPRLGERPMGEITARELLSLFSAIGEDAPSTARRAKRLASQIFQFAAARGDVSLDIASGLTISTKPVRKRHFAALTAPRDIADLMTCIDAYHGSATVRAALWFSLYTFQRPGEIRSAAWDEMDFGAKLWRIPAHRMKNKRPHVVPLSRQALRLLKSVKQLAAARAAPPSPLVFPSKVSKTAPMSALTVCAAIRTMGYTDRQMTAHGFRALASTNLNEQGWDSDVIELSLSHTEQNASRAAYNHAEKLPERREMMQAWADWLDGLRR
ncbi:MAG: tyrosine-type recombinase/integrase [Synergistaceae bacterium]|jgi:integrase|nr:tyrosine-type recombinase/integrase [Synergistaceae bacterium]